MYIYKALQSTSRPNGLLETFKEYQGSKQFQSKGGKVPETFEYILE